MPRLCPYCHKLGISTWRTLWSAAGPVECSNCHNVSRRKQQWSRYALLLIVGPWFVAAYMFHVDPNVTFLIAVPLLMAGTFFHYRFAKFVPITPPESNKCTSPSGS